MMRNGEAATIINSAVPMDALTFLTARQSHFMIILKKDAPYWSTRCPGRKAQRRRYKKWGVVDGTVK